MTTLDRLWSCLPYLRPMVTITGDSLSTEPTESGGRCLQRPARYEARLLNLNKLLDDRDFDVTCHNNLTRAISRYHLTELDVHDVLNIFQVTGLDPVDEIYFMEPSPAKKGDYFEFLAEIDLLWRNIAALAADLSQWGSGEDGSDPLATCRPLGVEVYEVDPELLAGWSSPLAGPARLRLRVTCRTVRGGPPGTVDEVPAWLLARRACCVKPARLLKLLTQPVRPTEGMSAPPRTGRTPDFRTSKHPYCRWHGGGQGWKSFDLVGAPPRPA